MIQVKPADQPDASSTPNRPQAYSAYERMRIDTSESNRVGVQGFLAGRPESEMYVEPDHS